MKKFIKAKSNQEESVYVECCCGCGIFKVEKSGDYYDLRYYSTTNLAKKDRHAWDILMTEQQFEEFLNALTELKCVK